MGISQPTLFIMTLLFAFLRLIRWPNLLFIAFTQSLFYFFVVIDRFPVSWAAYWSEEKSYLFAMLVMASVFIAAAGNIINDYFDMHIDAINKPDKNIVDRIIKRRWAMVWHLLLSFLGIVFSIYISWQTGQWTIAVANLLSVLLLWLYSTHFKRKLLSGNIIIAALSAWVVLVVYFFAGAHLFNFSGWHPDAYPFNIKRLFKITMFYAGFAFVVSLTREVVKDMEDMHGDAAFGCRTMPIVWGIPVSKMFVAVWMLVCMAGLMMVQLYAWQSGWWYVAVYSLLFMLLPLGRILQKLYRAQTVASYASLSRKIKVVMLLGILSMIFFKLLP